MKAKVPFFILALQCSLCKAQFHTVSNGSNLYKIETVAEVPGGNLATDIVEPSKEREVCNAVSDKDEVREQLIAQYISVSYPLKKIKVNSNFGMRNDPFTGKPAKHNGLDLHAQGDEVYSMLAGRIKKVGKDKRSGNYVVLEYGNYTVSYCHLSKVLVRKGDSVNAGDAVGISGSTGRSTGEHLHLTCKYKGKYVNPSILLDYVKETQAECLVQLKSIVV
ncbi:MAG: M23 family metallopeptidase [Prevotella sp.]|nr:M23 family metallopeptidase [Prevotella sp.]